MKTIPIHSTEVGIFGRTVRISLLTDGKAVVETDYSPAMARLVAARLVKMAETLEKL